MSGTSRILTLVFTDLADSTALKTQHGDRAVGELIARHRAHVRRLATESDGRIIDWAGDGCFLVFETPSTAVLFALRLQKTHGEEPDLPGVRTGIHMGEVSEEPGADGDAGHPRVEGLSVDLASRICGLAKPGQILMSSSVADSARQRLDSSFDRPVRWRTHGRYSLKGFDDTLEVREAGLDGLASFTAPVASDKAWPTERSRATARATTMLRFGLLAAAAGIVVTLVTWRTPQPPSVSVSGKKSVAVLPFVNMSSDNENEYFSDGITEDLITALSKVSGLRVAARTSSFAFKGKNEDVRTIGTKLNVGAVLEGSVSKAGNRVRITAQLISTGDGYHLWSESYDRELADIFAIRSQVAETVAKALQVTLAVGERQTIEQKPTEDLVAYELYLKGRHAAATFADWGNAMRYLQQAIARDPNYALPYLGLAYYYAYIVDYPISGTEALPRVREAAEKALALDPSLGEAHVNLGIARWWYDRDYPAALREYEKAVALQPASASAHEIYGWNLVGIGRVEEGLIHARRAVELDPLSSETNAWLGVNLYLARRYDDAIKQLRAAISTNPDYWYARLWLGRAYARRGKFSEAIAELRAAQKAEGSGNTELEGALGRAYAEAGNKTAARKMLEHLRERQKYEYVCASVLADVHIGLGQIDDAFAALAEAETEHSYYVGFWKVDPDLDPVRSDPRFTALLKRVNLAP